jgi:hypothetical protein
MQLLAQLSHSRTGMRQYVNIVRLVGRSCSSWSISLNATESDLQLVPQLSPQFPGSFGSARADGVDEMMPAGRPFI